MGFKDVHKMGPSDKSIISVHDFACVLSVFIMFSGRNVCLVVWLWLVSLKGERELFPQRMTHRRGPKELADYLKMLAANEQKYNEYLQWKKCA